MALNDERILGARIREERERSGMKQGELGSFVGLDRTVVNKIEGGVRRVTALELSSIADALGIRMASLLREPIPALVSHRSNQGLDTSDSKIDALLARLADDVELVHSLVPTELGLGVLDASGEENPLARPRSALEAENLANRTRELLQLDSVEPVKDLVSSAAKLGLLIFSSDLGADTADAGTILLRQGGVALVNSQNKVGRRRLAAAHELGHYLVADEYTVDWRVSEQGGDIEAALDRFARAILLPEAGLREAWARETKAYVLREVAVLLGSQFRVDMATLSRRLQELGIIGGDQASSIRTVTTTQADIIDFGLYVPAELSGTSLPIPYQRAVLRAFRDEKISSDRALDLLQDTFGEDDLPSLRLRREDEIWNFVS